MNTIVILGIVQCLFLTFLVLNKSKKANQEYWLAAFLIFNALHLLFFYGNFNENYLQYQYLLLAGSGFPLLSGPLFFIYVSALVNKKPMPIKQLLFHFLPYILFCLAFYYYHLFRPELTGIKVYNGFIHPYARGLIWPIRNVTILFAISGGTYALWTYFLLRRHTKRLFNEFSYFERINLDWIKYWIVLSIVSFIVGFFVILFVVDRNYPQRHDLAFKIIALMITGQVFFVGFYGFKQTTIFSSIDLDEVDKGSENKPGEKYAGSKLDIELAKKHVARLLQVMSEDKPYLNSELTIGMLSSMMGISSHHLSQILNDQLKKNFFDFVNEYRVEEVKKKIVDPSLSHMTLLGLAYDCGFNSKSSFNSIFKKTTGSTPSEFKKSNI